jgi:hypothetical protein
LQSSPGMRLRNQTSPRQSYIISPPYQPLSIYHQAFSMTGSSGRRALLRVLALRSSVMACAVPR